MKVRQSSMPKGNLKAVSVVVSLLIGCNKEQTTNSWDRKWRVELMGERGTQGEEGKYRGF